MKLIHYKTMNRLLKSISLSLIITLMLSLGYVAIEPALTEAATANDTVIITLNVDAGISITSPADTSMSTSLGVSANTAVATTTWNVKTNSAGGYTLGLQASTNPAMQTGGGITIDDFATSSGPQLWSVSSGNAKFGFSVYGTDVSSAKWGAGTSCTGAATSTVSTVLKYSGFYTTATTTAQRTSTTTTAGIDTTVCYAVEQNGFYIPSGLYTATITATATTL